MANTDDGEDMPVSPEMFMLCRLMYIIFGGAGALTGVTSAAGYDVTLTMVATNLAVIGAPLIILHVLYLLGNWVYDGVKETVTPTS